MPPPTPPGSEWVFRPRLPWKERLALLGCGAFAALGLFLAVAEPDATLTALLCVGFFGGLGLLVWLAVPRAVIFGDAITIRRRLRADKRIEYRDITGFGLGRLVARNGRLSWAQLENGSEVDEAVDRLIEAGVIPTDQLDDRALTNDVAGLEAGVVMVGVLVVLSALLFFGVVPSSWFDGYPSWVLELVVPLAVFGVAFLVIRYWRYRGPAA